MRTIPSGSHFCLGRRGGLSGNFSGGRAVLGAQKQKFFSIIFAGAALAALFFCPRLEGGAEVPPTGRRSVIHSEVVAKLTTICPFYGAITLFQLPSSTKFAAGMAVI